MTQQDKTSRPLRPRAGGLATALFLASLAATAVGSRFIGSAEAQTFANANDQPTARTLPPDVSTVQAHSEAAHRRNNGVSAPRALAPSTSVLGSGGRVNPKDHLPGAMRSGG